MGSAGETEEEKAAEGRENPELGLDKARKFWI